MDIVPEPTVRIRALLSCEDGGPWSRSALRALADAVQLSEGGSSCQLFSGFSGTGKSTELRRLAYKLEAAGFSVLVADAEDYHSLSRPLTVEDLMVVTAGAFGEATAARLGRDVAEDSYREPARLAVFREYVPVLHKVLEDGTLEGMTREERAMVGALMDENPVLCYRNGEGWFEVHPLVRDLVQELAAEMGVTGRPRVELDEVPARFQPRVSSPTGNLRVRARTHVCS